MKEYEIEVTEARKRFADVLNTAAYEGGRVVICRREVAERRAKEAAEKEVATGDG
jgi:antitoxin (DNA-binding transcriptional repressor) of toxin-antitoxin stability system